MEASLNGAAGGRADVYDRLHQIKAELDVGQRPKFQDFFEELAMYVTLDIFNHPSSVRAFSDRTGKWKATSS